MASLLVDLSAGIAWLCREPFVESHSYMHASISVYLHFLISLIPSFLLPQLVLSIFVTYIFPHLLNYLPGLISLCWNAGSEDELMFHLDISVQSV